MECLGHIISGEGVEADPNKVKDISNWALPKTVKQLRRFLGLNRYYKKFAKGYRIIGKPFFKVLWKEGFTWNQEAVEAFETLKKAMSTTLVLALPDCKKTLVLETDASE